ncbi:MAG: hypothetical protein QOK39_110 [Acidimicrobiaceae bacterium]|nr:hypothetical protein [Acidimicrobiaceae bacterium]
MVPIIQKRIVKGGIAKQTAKGAAAAAATFAFGVTDGSVFGVDVTESELGQTWSSLSVLGFDRSEVKPKFDLGVNCTPALTGLLCLLAQGTDVVTGTGPFTHTLTPATDYPYATLFGTLGVADWAKIVDGKLSSLEFAWDNAGGLKAKIVIPGITPSLLASAYTETNQELIATTGVLAAAGGVFKVEGVTAQIQSGSVKIDTKAAQVPGAASVSPLDVIPGKREVTWQLKIVPNDTGLFREVVFGSGAAGALSAVAVSPRLGSCESSFVAGTSSLDLLSTAVKFAVAWPAAGADGGPAEITLMGIATLPAAGVDLTAVAINGVATY